MEVVSKKISLFDQIEFVGPLGRGSFGRVDGYMLPDGSVIAIKNIMFKNFIDPEILAEINSLQTLKGKPHINQLLDIRINDSTSIDLMLVQHTGSLSQFITLVNQYDRVRVYKSIADQLTLGLYYIHSSYITHRDIKPSNIFVDFKYNQKTGELLMDPVCYYADFGLSSQLPYTEKSYEPRSTGAIGTSGYRAPELLNDDEYYLYSPDVWALGITLMNYLTDDLYLYADSIQQELHNIYALSDNKKLPGIDVVSILNKHGIIIDKYYVDMLKAMLLYDVKRRVEITDIIIYPVTYPQINYLPSYTKDTYITSIARYFELKDWAYTIAKYFNLTVTSLIIADDLFIRYLHNYITTTPELIYAACISIGSKTGDYLGIDLASLLKYVDHTLEQLKAAEILVIERMNYMYMSRDIRPLIDKVYTTDNPYLSLKNVYTSLKKQNNII